jgi:hypothetical protein
MIRRAALLAMALTLCGCASVGTYHPQGAGAQDGYSEHRLDEMRWRVEFIGDSSTSQQRVESYLLYRAAEVTVSSGFEWFMPADHAVEEETEIVVQAQPQPVQSAAWRPLWRHRKRFFWSDWMPAGSQPPPDSDLQRENTWTISRYAAREDIIMGRGAMPQGAFNAREILTLLEPSIVRP